MNNSISKLMPVLFGFFVMGFCDVVGISTSYVKSDFDLSESLAGLIPSMVFIWFLLLSLPFAMLMNRIGRKQMVQLSNVVTIIGMLIPFFHYDFVTCMVAFVLLGIGNTMLQVSLMPLLSNVVKGETYASSLTTGQVVKAVSSFAGPFIAAFAAKTLGNWQYLFPIYAAITLLSAFWLLCTPIKEDAPATKSSSMGEILGLLKDKRILILFFGIFFVVGVDVGTNTVAPKLLIERAGMSVEEAGYGSSVYFVCRTIGALIGSFMLMKISERLYFRLNIFAALITIGLLFFLQATSAVLALVGLIGFFCSSIFPIIYSAALKARPEKENEISGLMIMGVFGGAVIPPAMGIMTDLIGNQAGSLIVLTGTIVYLTGCALWLKGAKK
ncbi:MAG: MFS transporter [Alistipes sp.]|nr:sugar MFS transporter [Rikenellaceae bacterium]MBO5187768.1 MFS transporter [Alistipes sp.]MBQ3083300.1 MFS transporter [Alistipes sp.]MBQ7296808.1 MFS transporter [Alistipes sp.]MBQ8471741.1 MFS transporter [Alistipes sp.]